MSIRLPHSVMVYHPMRLLRFLYNFHNFATIFLIIHTNISKCEDTPDSPSAAPVGQNMLVWKRVEYPLAHEKYYTTDDTGRHIFIDGSVTHQVNVKLNNQLTNTDLKITFMCRVMDLSPTMPITSMNFCWKPSRSLKEICHDVFHNQRPIYPIDVRFTVIADNLRGANITTDWNSIFSSSKNRSDVSGWYYCKFGNALGLLQSTTMEVEDLMIIYKEISLRNNAELQVVPQAPITPYELPLTLDCPQAPVISSGAAQSLLFPMLHWKFCHKTTSESFTAVKCLLQLTMSGSSASNVESVLQNYVLHVNGSITILSLNEQELTNGILVCYDVTKPEKYYGMYAGEGSSMKDMRPLLVDGRRTYKGPPVPISPSAQTVSVRAGKYTSAFSLMAYYRANFDSVSSRWLKNGVLMSSSLPMPKARFQYNLGFMITDENEGVYKLEISSNNNGLNLLTFTFDVKVLSPPTPTNDFDTEEFIMAGENFTTSVAFKQAHNIYVLLNGEPVMKNSGFSADEFERIASQLKMPGLRGTISPAFINPILPITYTVTPISVDHSHTISFEAQNPVGIVVLNKVLRVVPKPAFEITPNQHNCTHDCLTTSTHTFRCVLQEDNRRAILRTGALLNISWYVGETIITEENFRRYKYLHFFDLFNSHKGELTLHAVTAPTVRESKDSVLKEALRHLRDTSVQCVVQLFEPPSSPSNSPQLLYTSRFDPELSGMLTATLQWREQVIPVITASSNWIWILILVLVILLLVAILIGYLLCRHREGATYLVDEQERATGNDPEKEIKEKEAFHTYERDGEDPGRLRGSRMSLANSVGIHSESDEDYDMYGLDPGKFNEDGSFIYRYGGNNHRHQNQPPQPNNTPAPPPPHNGNLRNNY